MEQPKERKGAAATKAQGSSSSAVNSVAGGREEVPMFPVKKAVLSKTGIGYFEREDAVSPGRPFELFFKSGDMNDVLKSLTMVDVSDKAGSGLVSSISYESTRPFDKQLDDLSISLNEDSTLRDLLSQVKGTPVQVEVLRHGRQEVVEGVVIGLEHKTLEKPSYHGAHFLSLLVQGKAIQYYNLYTVTKIKFMNELMQQDLRHLLTILLQAKKKDLKSVTGYTRGATERRSIRASYIVEAPVWKTTYRVLFNNKKEVKSVIEGWALVDNTQNEDWRGVELSLVSGASNSFIYDLYNPRYASRTEIEVEQEETLAPPTLEDAVAQHDLSELSTASAIQDEKESTIVRRARAMPSMAMACPPPPMACAPPPAPMAYGAPPPMMARSSMSYSMAPEADMLCLDSFGSIGGGGPPPPPPAEFSRSEASSSVEVNAEAKKMEMADLFQYKITNAVNVNRNQSALVPFLHTEFNGVKASIYNKARHHRCSHATGHTGRLTRRSCVSSQNVREDNPLAVIKFKNSFGVPLESGPLCLFEDDVYVGECMLPRVKVNEEIYAAYAVDLKTTVTMTNSSELRTVYRAEAAQLFDWERGILFLRRKRVHEFTYVIDNKNERDIDHFYLEHGKQATELIETAEPDERLAHFYRFKLKVPAKQVVKFVVKEQSAEDQKYQLENTTKAWVEEWSAAGYIPADVKKTLEAIAKRNEKAARLQKKINRSDAHLRSLNEDISRIDSCLGSLALSKSSFFAEQDKFRDFFTKELNAVKAEQTKVEKEHQTLIAKRLANAQKKTALVNTVSFTKSIS